MTRISALYEGRVHHTRLQPKPHQFTYRLFMMYLDLNELPELFDGIPGWSAKGPAPARFKRGDYLRPTDIPLDMAVREAVREASGFEPAGPIRMLTHLRYFGYCMNPVTFYYCYNTAGDQLQAIVADINNTPWDERHHYVLTPSKKEGAECFVFAKDFHVSPFMPMDMTYHWTFSTPGPNLNVHMENQREGSRCFTATLSMERREISRSVLMGALIRYPLMTAKVTAAIYYQALRLWLKRTPFYDHPQTLKESKELLT